MMMSSAFGAMEVIFTLLFKAIPMPRGRPQQRERSASPDRDRCVRSVHALTSERLQTGDLSLTCPSEPVGVGHPKLGCPERRDVRQLLFRLAAVDRRAERPAPELLGEAGCNQESQTVAGYQLVADRIHVQPDGVSGRVNGVGGVGHREPHAGDEM